MSGTKGFRYVYAPAQMTKLLNKVQTTGRPETLNFPYVRDTWLLKNKQYGAAIQILKDMQFIDSSGKPTELYAEYQNAKIAKQALAKGIKNAYPALFKAFPNAQSLSLADLEGYFKQQTGKAGSVLNRIVSTFRTLCNLADFAAMGVIEEEPAPGYALEGGKERRVKFESKIQVNVEIHIAPDTPDDKIEKIFKNMKNYLLGHE